jgi:TonB family protein
MRSSRLVAVCVVSLCFFLLRVQAQASSAYLGSKGTRAVDAKGVRHNGNDYPSKHPPWLDEVVKTVAPDYPHLDQAQRHQGVGWFHLMLDERSGAVTKVTVIKSTGFSTLDSRAMTALREWRWKPWKWKAIDMPVTFELASASAPPPPGSIRLPPR